MKEKGGLKEGMRERRGTKAGVGRKPRVVSGYGLLGKLWLLKLEWK
jgi:hypothetical protein